MLSSDEENKAVAANPAAVLEIKCLLLTEDLSFIFYYMLNQAGSNFNYLIISWKPLFYEWPCVN